MGVIKQISVCTGFDNQDNPIWSTRAIGANGSNVSLTQPIFNKNNVENCLKEIETYLEYTTNNSEEGKVLYIGQNNQIMVSKIPIAWLEQLYDQQNPEPEQEPEQNQNIELEQNQEPQVED